MGFGNRLQQIRKAAGLSQEQLADMMGMSRQAVSKWETEQSLSDIERASQLCGILGVSADELLSGDTSAGGLTNGGLEHCVRMNMKRRFFTAGWISALAGAVLLVLEYFSLFFLRDAAIRLDHSTNIGLGFYSDPMHYAAISPMPLIFGITIALIAAGILAAIAAAVSMGRKKL